MNFTRTSTEVVRGLAAALSIVAVVLAIGCNRKAQLIPADADSTAALDSSAIFLREVQMLWEGGASAEAAEQTARVVHDRLVGLPPDQWKERADLLLDSLGIGYESATAEGALLLNLFSRADPSAGSWPWLLTTDGADVSVQTVEGKNLRLTHLASRGLGVGNRFEPGVAALFGRRAGAGHQPVLMVWNARPGEGWRLVQTLGPDSLGGTGTAEFVAPADTVVELVSRTYRTPAGFDECATCPHLYRVHRFQWGPRSFVRANRDSVIASPYAAFVGLVQALAANDESRGLSVVSDSRIFEQARQLGWGARRGAWRVAPGAGESATPVVFFRGNQEAYRVHFAPRGDAWVITGFEETTRSLE